MIPKEAGPGDDTAGLLFYLYGPGKRDKHTNPHMVAACGPYFPDPARSDEFTIPDLAALLDAPVRVLLGRKPPLHFSTSRCGTGRRTIICRTRNGPWWRAR
ncbi:hypothetical protein [Streptomyces sp. NPDC055036]